MPSQKKTAAGSLLPAATGIGCNRILLSAKIPFSQAL
jgi:hypothetical protein